MSTGAGLQSANRWLNCFQYCTKALRIFGNVMVVLVVALVLLSWSAVVLATYGPAAVGITRVGAVKAAGAWVVCAVYTLMAGMVLWSYFAAVLTDPGRVPPGWHPFLDEQQARHELERMQFADYYQDRRNPRRPRWCKRCQCWKPERAHHCSMMGRCVLKMDHHCIWTANCVGLLNYKFFLLFLVYVFLSSLAADLLLLRPLIDFFTNKLRGPWALVVFVAVVMDGAFAASVAGFLIMHAQLLAVNCTTIEMYEKDRIHPWPYNKGWRRNLEEVFGRSKLHWFLPYYTKEERRAMVDGCLNTRLMPSTFLQSAVV